MILVTGGTGTVGKELVKALSSAGVKFRVLTRDPGKAEALKLPGVELYRGDMEKPDTLPPALKGVDKLFLLSSADPRQTEIQGRVVDAARAAGVKHVVKLSALGADEKSPINLAQWHGRTEKRIEKSGIAWTHIQPHFFMQNTLMFAPTVKAQGAIYAPMKDGRISLVDVRDIAAVAAKVLTSPGHEGKRYAVTGPEALSFGQIAEKISRAIGKPVKYVDVPPADARKAMLAAGFPDWLADGLLGLYAVFSAGHAAAVSGTVREVTGGPGISFDKFAQDHAAVFK